MTLYFDTKVQFLDSEAISTIGVWHPNEPLIAIASYSQDRGGSVTIFDDTGEPLHEVSYPVHPVSQATALCWHPERRLLVTGWENGEVHAWSEGHREFSAINGPHKAPIMLLAFSEMGGRMVTADSIGVLTGWRCDNHGQFLTMFTHDLHDPLLHITFRKTVQNATSNEITNLARAAVAGDETALDTLTNWRPRTAARNLSHSGVKDNHCFYVGTQTGVIYYLNQSGTCTEVLRTDNAPIIQILWHPRREAIVTLMEDMTVGHYLVESTGYLTELDRVKLSGRMSGHNSAISWASGALAIITGDLSVRIWDIDTSDNYLLGTELANLSNENDMQSNKLASSSGSMVVSPTSPPKTITPTTTVEIFTCISYCPSNQTLCAGTNQGNLYTWKRTTTGNFQQSSRADQQHQQQQQQPENLWQLNNISGVRGAIKQCLWGITETTKPCIMVNCISNVFILKEQPLMSYHTREFWATQKSANQVNVEYITGDKSAIINADISITDLCINNKHLIITNGRNIIVYKINKDDNDDDDIIISSSGTNIETINKKLIIKLLNNFTMECHGLFIYEQNIIVLNQLDVKIMSLGGVKLQEITFSDMEGRPIGADLTSNYLTIFTMNGYIKIYDISRHEPKSIIQTLKSGYDLFENFGEIIMAKCSPNGKYLALIIATENLIPDGKLYIWDFEKDLITSYDYIRNDMNSLSEKKETVARLPIIFFWDTDDGRLLACEAKCIHHNQQQQQQHQQQKLTKSPAHSFSAHLTNSLTVASCNFNIAESETYIMFITDKCEIKILETLPLASGEQLINLCAPHAITLKISVIGRIPLRDFKGLEKCDGITRKMVLDFSLNVALGNMDQAFSCIRSIQSEAVWTNLAKMCVQTGRLDVAKVCLGHLKRACSVRALRKAIDDESLEDEAKVAVLAIELGMLDEAEMLYKKCGRFDLLNRLLQASGKFEEALQIAEQCDRVHLKNTYYTYAEWLRDQGDVQNALIYFDKSNNPTHNVTQMLMEDPVALREYMQNTKDTNLLKWWAQYIESTGDMDSSFKIYQKADDWFSQVRILCFLGQLTRADTIARHSGDRAACYHLARHYESIDRVQDAIQFYTRAQTYGNAVRICKENDLQDELWSVANSARSRDKAIAAAFYEDCGDYKRAVELYHRSGMLHKAVEMAFASKQPETLQVIASELDINSDPELVSRCAEFFLSIEQPQKAVHLLANTHQFEKALDVCGEYSVPITESLAEMLTPAKDELLEATRVKVLTLLGDILQEQGDYHSATKKFTQAGDKIRAMKSLLKSGDTDKIVFFAGMSRQKEVYVMAGNYLQALNWQSDPKILKSIVTFYTKGQAYDLLANFYATCAQVEIDEFRDYEKALKALQEAGRCLSKIPNMQRPSEQLQITILEVRKVLELQEAFERGEYPSVINGCRNLLTTQERPPVRQTDILALLIEALISGKQFTESLSYLRELTLKAPDWSLRGFIERNSIEKLSKECGIEFNTLWNSGRNHQRQQHNNGNENRDGDFDEVDEEEEIQEEFE